MCVCVSRLVNGVNDHSIVTRRDGNKGEGPRHQFVVVLQYEVLWPHFQHGYVGVLGERETSFYQLATQWAVQ